MNEHATSVLDAYLEANSLPFPHAILVEGPWGSGKTYFLEENYEPRRQKLAKEKRFYRTPFLFVSLFGVKSASEMENRIHRAANPSEAAIGKFAGTAILDLGGAFRIRDTVKSVLDRLRKAAWRRHAEYILVFDDLERVEKGALGEVMGLVNSIITTHRRRVILVGVESKLLELHPNTNWQEQNEKIIGRRVRIEPDVESVIRTSVSMFDNPSTQVFITEHLDALAQLARRSDVANLRNLSWAVFNGANFVRCLLADPEIPKDHVARVLFVVVATTLWYRSGKLSDAALGCLPDLSITLAARSIRRRDQHEVEDPDTATAKQFAETFAELAVDSPPLEYQLIVEFEGSGILSEAEFIAWTKCQFGFGRGRSEPSWRRLWHSYERPMAETDAALEELRGELIDKVHVNRGAILHAAGLAIKFSLAGDNRLTDDQPIVPFFKTYIDSLAERGTLGRNVAAYISLGYDGADGLGFSSRDTPEFEEIESYMAGRQAEMQQIDRKLRADEIIQRAEAGDFEALHKLNATNDDLSRNPVLIDIDVDRIATLIAKDVPTLNVGAKMLAFRYHRASHGEPLLTEIPWARQVYSAILQKMADWPEPHHVMATENLEGVIRHYERGRCPCDQIIPAGTGADANDDQMTAEPQAGY